MGSTLAARRAGITLAMNAASDSDTTAATNARGSVGSSRNRNASDAALRYHAATPPIPSPDATSAAALTQHHPDHARARGTERHADANLARALRDEIRHDAVDADSRDHQTQQPEESQQQHGELALRDSSADQLFHRSDVAKGNVRQHREHGRFHGRQ